MIEQMEKQMKFAEMRDNMEMYEQIRNEIESLSVGQMVNMYEVHVRNLEDYDTEDKIE